MCFTWNLNQVSESMLSRPSRTRFVGVEGGHTVAFEDTVVRISVFTATVATGTPKGPCPEKAWDLEKAP
jgi:hypothetical protein